MRRSLSIGLILALLCLALGYALHEIQTRDQGNIPADRLVAVSWGDGKYGNGFYGACVYLVPISQGYSVRAQVLIGRSNGMSHDCGELGKAADAAEAVAKWGKITWRSDGLYIGMDGPDDFFLARQKIEAHR